MPGFGIQTQHIFYNFFCPSVFEIPRETYIALNDKLIDLIRILSIWPERKLPHHKLVKHYPKRPQVHKFTILLSQHNFGRHIMRGPNNSRSLVTVLYLFA